MTRACAKDDYYNLRQGLSSTEPVETLWDNEKYKRHRRPDGIIIDILFSREDTRKRYLIRIADRELNFIYDDEVDTDTQYTRSMTQAYAVRGT